MEFEVDLAIIEKYLDKYEINHPDEFLIHEHEENGKTSYIFDKNDLSINAEDIATELRDLIQWRVKTQPSFRYFEELCFIIAYLDYYNRLGIIHNQAVDSYYFNLRSLIKAALNIKRKASPTKLNLDFTFFHSHTRKARSTESVEFDLFQNTPTHLSRGAYLKLLARLINFNTSDSLFQRISNDDTTVEELEAMLKDKDILPNAYVKDDIKYRFANILLDFLETEMKFTRKAKVASSEEIEIIYYILFKIEIIADIERSGSSLSPLDSFRKDITRNLPIVKKSKS